MVNKEFIPNGWRKVTIDDICELRRGASPRPISDPKYFGNGAGWVRISDVTRAGNYLKQTEQYLSKLGESKSVKVTPGEVIMSICATIGRPIIVDMEACIHDGFVVFKNLSEHVNNLFFLYWLKTKENYFNSLGQQGTQKNLNTNIVKKTEILLPPLPVQRKIATILSSVDEAIEKTEAIIEQTEKVKKGLMQQLLTKGIGHTKFKKTEIGEIPEEWEVRRLEEICEIRYGKSPKGVKVEYSDYPIMGTSGHVGYAKEFLFSGPMILVGRKGTIDKPIYIERDCWIIDTAYGLFADQTKVSLKWLYYFLTSYDLASLNEATGVPSLNRNSLYSIKVPLPSLNEQNKISNILTSIEQKIETEKEKLSIINEIKKGLMQSLLTGKVRVKVDEDEVVSS